MRPGSETRRRFPRSLGGQGIAEERQRRLGGQERRSHVLRDAVAADGRGHDQSHCRKAESRLKHHTSLTSADVARRTSGKTPSKVGNATAHEMAQAPSQIRTNPGAKPIPRSVLMNDTMNVMSSDSNIARTMPP